MTVCLVKRAALIFYTKRGQNGKGNAGREQGKNDREDGRTSYRRGRHGTSRKVSTARNFGMFSSSGLSFRPTCPLQWRPIGPSDSWPDLFQCHTHAALLLSYFVRIIRVSRYTRKSFHLRNYTWRSSHTLDSAKRFHSGRF